MSNRRSHPIDSSARWARAWCAGLLLLTVATAATAQESAPGGGEGRPAPSAVTPKPTPTPSPEDLTTTMTLQLKNQNIEQLVKFLGETTGKPLIYDQKDVGSVQVTVSSPKPVTRGKALELIYDALLMQGIYVIELDDQIRIVKAEAIKNMQFQTLDEKADLQSMADSNRMVQKVYKPRNISAANLKAQLAKFVPESSLTVDEAGNTFIIVDQLTRLKRYDRIIQSLDQTDGDRVVQFFQVEHSDALELAALLAGVLKQQAGQNDDIPSRPGGGSRGRVNQNSAQSSYAIGEVTIVPDPRLNLLIVSCPRNKLADVTQLIQKLDQPKSPDIQTRMIEVKHVEPDALASRINDLFQADNRQAEKERVQVTAYTEGNRLIVRSSKENYETIKKIIEDLDTELSEKRETRTYPIKHLEATELAQQLTTLFEEQRSSSYDYYDYYYGSSRNTDKTKPKFIAIARNNQLVAMAKPKDFQLIEEMIKQLDSIVDSSAIEPRIYQIRNTDANELVKVMEELFREGSRNQNNEYEYWRPNTNQQKGSIQSIFGDIRFVVDNVTNRVVVLTSHPENYSIIDSMIEKFDHFDPDSSEVLVCELKYADALDVADRLNALFSDGPVQMPQQQQQQQQQQRNQQDDNEQQVQNTADAIRQVVYPWQSGSRDRKAGEEEARPINTMIGNVRVVPDARSSKLLIAAPPIYFQALRQVIANLDRPEPQVNISTKILEITRGQERRIGIRWTPDPTTIDPAELDNAVVGLGQLGFLDAFGGGDTGPTDVGTERTFGGIGRSLGSATGAGSTILSADVNLALLIQLLLKNSESRILSEPNLTVNNNERGIVFVGSEFPFRTGTFTQNTGAQTESIDYRKIGVNLNLKPQINVNGEIVMTVQLENSSIRDERVSGDLVTNLTTMDTQLAVDSGQTMVIGGIHIENTFETRRKTPILGSIPVIKWFFTKRDAGKSTRELMVFLTPNVLKNREDDESLLRSTNERVEKIDEQK